MFYRSCTHVIIGSIVASSLSIGTVFAAASDDVLVEHAAVTGPFCMDVEPDLYSRCFNDVRKRIKTLDAAFQKALKEERRAWNAEHSSMGVTAEFRAALKAYTDEVRMKQLRWTAQQKEIEKALFDEQKEIRSTAGVTPAPGNSPTVVPSDMEAAQAACSEHTRPATVRVCLRNHLRMQQPITRRLNARIVQPKK